MEVNAYVATCYVIIYALQVVKRGNILIPVQAGYQFASPAIRIALVVMDQKKLNA